MPCLDQLTQILVEQLVPDFDLKLTQYNKNVLFHHGGKPLRGMEQSWKYKH